MCQDRILCCLPTRRCFDNVVCKYILLWGYLLAMSDGPGDGWVTALSLSCCACQDVRSIIINIIIITIIMYMYT